MNNLLIFKLTYLAFCISIQANPIAEILQTNAFNYAKGALYQLIHANRFFGAESGSCQNWSILRKTPLTGWQTTSTMLQHNNSRLLLENRIDTITADDKYDTLTLIIKEMQKRKFDTSTIYMPLNVQIQNIFFQSIYHKVTLKAEIVNNTIKTINIMDPQTSLSAYYLSNTAQIFAQLQQKTSINLTYTPLGLQLPFTGNCQKLSAYIAITDAENKIPTMEEGNKMCSLLHKASQKLQNASEKGKSLFGKAKSFFGY